MGFKRRSLPARVTLICGPPASGKTTYVNEHSRPGDIVWDLDEVLKAICGDAGEDRPPASIAIALSMRDGFIGAVAERRWPRPPQAIWIIEGLPKRGDRQNRAELLGAEVILLDTPKEECLRRAATRKNPNLYAIEKWFSEHERDP